MTCLLDVNLLIALIDPSHLANAIVQDWFAEHARTGWATCPITENGAIRIVSHARYPNRPGSPEQVIATLASLREWPGHEFWSDAISLLTDASIDRTRIHTAGQVTDTYLLALAVAHGGRLATLDQRLATNAVGRGRETLLLIDPR